MAIIPTSEKEFTFTQGVSSATKKYADDVFSSITIVKDTFVAVMTPEEFNDFYQVVFNAYNHIE